jgi:hypothetical protein
LRKGGGGFNNDILRDQRDQILRGFSAMDDDFDAFGSNSNPKTDGGIDSQKSL